MESIVQQESVVVDQMKVCLCREVRQSQARVVPSLRKISFIQKEWFQQESVEYTRW